MGSLLQKLTKVFLLIKDNNLLSEGKVLYSLLKDYKNGSYREISKKSMLIIIGGLLYLVNPADVIPDFVPLIGFLDDATLIGLIFKQLNEELTKYKSFKVKKEGFDDNKHQKLFEAQMNAWALMFSSGLLTTQPSIISNDSASALYNTLKPR